MKAELNKIWHPRDGEILLFRKMSHILSFLYNVTFVQEVHARRVHFTSPSVSASVSREIADLWIIAYSPAQQKGKMTFLQAKYHRGHLASPALFGAEYFQYELLSQRLPLTSGGTLNLPNAILNTGCCDSVGSYGVFYLDSKNRIDLAYCCASLLKAVGTLPTAAKSFSIKLQFPTMGTAVGQCNGCDACNELNYTYDINAFTDSILNLEIGADIQHYPEILAYVRSVTAKLPYDPAVGELLSFISNIIPPQGGGTDNDDTGSNDGGLPGSLMIINVDGKEGFRSIPGENLPESEN